MHKYRSAAKRAAWYDDEDDIPSYNPFKKIRPRATRSGRSYSDAEISRPEGPARVQTEGLLRPPKERFDEEEPYAKNSLLRSKTEGLPRRKQAGESDTADINGTRTTLQNEEVDGKVDEPDLEPGLAFALDRILLEDERAKVQAELSRNQEYGLSHRIRRFLVPWRRKDTDTLTQGLSSTGLIISGTVFLAKPHPVSSRRRAFVISLRLIEGEYRLIPLDIQKSLLQRLNYISRNPLYSIEYGRST